MATITKDNLLKEKRKTEKISNFLVTSNTMDILSKANSMVDLNFLMQMATATKER